jgi:hypothetical protein
MVITRMVNERDDVCFFNLMEDADDRRLVEDLAKHRIGKKKKENRWLVCASCRVW